MGLVFKKEGLNFCGIWIKRREEFGEKKLVMTAEKRLPMAD
jgi:hypothetical protein